MKVQFDNTELEELYITPLSELKGKQKVPFEVIKQFKKKVPILMSIGKLEDLKPFRGLNFEYLKGDRSGECSIRLNKQYRLIFVPTEEGEIKILLVTEISKHYE